jgi:hypothetical protein
LRYSLLPGTLDTSQTILNPERRGRQALPLVQYQPLSGVLFRQIISVLIPGRLSEEKRGIGCYIWGILVSV